MESKSWDGGDDDWSLGQYWLPTGAPGATDDVSINSGDPQITTNVSAVNSVTVSATLDVVSGGALATIGDFTNLGNVFLDRNSSNGGAGLDAGGTVDNIGFLEIGGASQGAAASVAAIPASSASPTAPDTLTAEAFSNTGELALVGASTNIATLDVLSQAGFGADGVLSGSVDLSDDTLLEFASGQIATISGSLTLDGTNAFVADAVAGGGVPTGNSALAGLTAIGGDLSLSGGATIVTTGALSSTGNINLESNSLLDVNGPAGLGTPGQISGEVELFGGGVLEFASGGIASIASGAYLTIGSQDSYVADAVAGGGAPTTNSALTGLASNAGTLDLEDGASIATTGDFENDGSLLVDKDFSGGSSLAIGGTLTNTGGLEIGSGSTEGFGGLEVSTTVTAGGLSNGSTGFIDLAGSSAATAALYIDAAAGFGAPGALTGEVALSGDAVLGFANGGIASIAQDGSLTLSGPDAFVADAVAGGLAPTSDNALTSLASNAGTLSLVGVSLSITGDLTNTGAILVNSLVTGDNQQIVSAGLLDIEGALSGAGSLTLDGGIVELGGAASATITFGGIFRDAPATLLLDAPAEFDGTISGLSLDDTIDLAGVDATSAVIDGSALTVTQSEGQTLQFQLSNVQAGAHFAIQTDNAGGSDLVLSSAAVPPVITAPATATATEGLATSLGALSIADPNADAGILTVDLEDSYDGEGGTLAADQSGAGTVTNEGGVLVLTGDLTDVNNELATVTYTGALRVSSALTEPDFVSINVSDSIGQSAAQSIDVTVGVGPLVITAPQSPAVIDFAYGSLGALSLADGNGANELVTVTVSAGTGTLSVSQSGSATVVGDDTGRLILTGSVADVDNELANLDYAGGGLPQNANEDVGSGSVTIDATDAQGSQDQQIVGVTIDVAPYENFMNDAPTLESDINAFASKAQIAADAVNLQADAVSGAIGTLAGITFQQAYDGSSQVIRNLGAQFATGDTSDIQDFSDYLNDSILNGAFVTIAGGEAAPASDGFAASIRSIINDAALNPSGLGFDSELFQLDIKGFFKTVAGSAFDDSAWQTAYSDGLQAEDNFVTDVLNSASYAQILTDTSAFFTTVGAGTLDAIGDAAPAAENALAALNTDIAGGASTETLLTDVNGIYEPLVATAAGVQVSSAEVATTTRASETQTSPATASNVASQIYNSALLAANDFGPIATSGDSSRIISAASGLYGQAIPSIMGLSGSSSGANAALSTYSTLIDQLGSGDGQAALETASNYLSAFLGPSTSAASQQFQAMAAAITVPSSTTDPTALANYAIEVYALIPAIVGGQSSQVDAGIQQALQSIVTDGQNSPDSSAASSDLQKFFAALSGTFTLTPGVAPELSAQSSSAAGPSGYTGKADPTTAQLFESAADVFLKNTFVESATFLLAKAETSALAEGLALLVPGVGEIVAAIAIANFVYSVAAFAVEHDQPVPGIKDKFNNFYNNAINGIAGGIYNGAKALVHGDIHITTFSGLYYDFQAEGEFVLTQSTQPGNSFQIQVRLAPPNSSASVTVTTGIAAEVGTDRVTFDINRPDTVWVNGVASTLSATNSVLNLSGGQVVELSPTQFQIAWSTGESMTVSNEGTFFDYSVGLGPNDAGAVRGLLGQADGQANDFALPDGTVLAQPLTSAEFYGEFANAWRVTDASSLLDYEPGQTTATFTDVNFPGDALTLADLPANLVAQAAQLAAAAGITDPTIAAGAELDYLATGDPGFITAAANSQDPESNVTPADITPSVAAASLGVTAAQAVITPASGQTAQVTFNVYLTSAAASDTVVDYTAISPSADALDAASFGGTPPSGQLTIAAGQTSGTFAITLPANVLGQTPDAILAVQISAPGGAPIFASTAQTVIVNPQPEPGVAPLPAITELTAAGKLAQNGAAYVVDLGTLVQGQSLPVIQFSVVNGAAVPADELGGTLSASGAGFAVAGAGALVPIAASQSYDNLYVAPDTDTVGQNSETITLLPTELNASGYSAALSNLTLTIDDTVIAAAQAVVNSPTTIDFGDLRVGASANQNVSITNSAAAGSAALDATVSVNGGAVANGAIANLAAGATDATDISVGLQTSVAGASSGSVTLNLASDAGGDETAALLNQTIEVSGAVYREAAAQIAPISEIVHVGDPGIAALTLTNADPADGYSENLLASVASTTGAVSATGATGEIAGGQSDSTSLGVAFSTETAGQLSGSVKLNLQSDGTGIDGFGPASLASMTAPVSVTVDNFAQAALAETSGGGVLSQSGANYTLNLGDIAQNSAPVTIGLEALNAASGPADLLSGSFQIVGSSAFAASGLDSFSGLGAGQADRAPSITLNTGDTGVFSTVLTLDPIGSNASGFSGALGAETLTITGSVVVPGSPPTITGTVGSQKTTSEAPVTPFSTAVVGDPNQGADDTLTIALSGGGTLSGSVLSFSGGVYELSGSASTITSELQALTFTAAAGGPDTRSTTTFTLTDRSSVDPMPATDSTTTVIDTDPAIAPKITGAQHGQTTQYEASTDPFSSVTINDPNAGADDALTITLGGAGGTLSGAGLAGGADGVYTLSGAASAVTAEIRRLAFTANAGELGTTSTTTFALSDKSTAYGSAADDATTSVIDSDVPVAPTISGPSSEMTRFDATYSPFAGYFVNDINPGADDTLQISATGAGGTLSGTGLTQVNGVYTLTGAPDQITAELDNLKFAPGAAAFGTQNYTHFSYELLTDVQTPGGAVHYAIDGGDESDNDDEGDGGDAWGDVHLTTYDGLAYNFQAEGEFTLTKSTLSGDSFEVQVRLQPLSASSSVSVMTEVAAQVGADRVTFEIGRDDVVWVNGAASTLSMSHPLLNLSGGSAQELSPDVYQIAWNTGETLEVDNDGAYFKTTAMLGPNDGPGTVEGLLGAADGAANDFTLSNGTVLSQPLSSSQLYGEFADSWRVSDDDTLFDYAPGQSTATFTDRNFPDDAVSLADLPASVVAQAASLAAAAGITDPNLAADAELDYIETGDTSYIASAAAVQNEETRAGVSTTPASVTAPPADAALGVQAASANGTIAQSGQPTQVTFDVYLTSALTTATIVDYQVVTGSAGAFTSADFGGTLPSGQITLAAGQTQGQLTISTPTGALGSQPEKTLEVAISSSGAPLFAAQAQTEVVSGTPIAGAPAIATLQDLIGGGVLTQSGDGYLLNLGYVKADSGQAITLGIANAAADVSDELGGSLAVTSGSGFVFTGDGALTPLVAGGIYRGLTVAPSANETGAQTETLTFTPLDLNVSGYSAALPTITLTVEDTVIPSADSPPTITGTVAQQKTTSEASVTPFSTAVVGDVNPGANDTLTIALSDGGGALNGNGLSFSNGSYQLSGTAAIVTTQLQALTFIPTAGTPGTTATTAFTLSDQSSNYATPTDDATTSVIDIDPAVAPAITGAMTDQTTSFEAAIQPFSAVKITDPNAGGSDSLTITLTGAGGTLLDGANFNALIDERGGVYTLNGNAASLTSELDALSFAPITGAPDTFSTTYFELSDVSSAFATATIDETTSVVDQDPATPPIDLNGLAFKESYEALWRPQSGVLRIIDASNADQVLDTIQLKGTYADTAFSLAPDGRGGTEVTASVEPWAQIEADDTLTTSVNGESYFAYENKFVAGNFAGVDLFYAAPAGASLSVYGYDFAPGGQFMGSQFYYAPPDGAAYASEEIDYNGAGQLTRADFTGVAGQPFSSYEYDYAGSAYVGATYVFTNVPAGASYSSYVVDVDASGAFSGEQVYYSNIAGQSYTGEELDFDASSSLTRILLTGVEDQAYSSLALDYSNGSYAGYQAYYTGIKGQTFTQEEVDVSAANQLTKVVYSGMTSTPYSSLEVDYSSGAMSDLVFSFTNVSNPAYSDYQLTTSPTGTALQETVDLASGGHDISALASGQSLTSLAGDTFVGFGSGATTFVLNSQYGSDAITNFTSADTLSLNASEYAQLPSAIANGQYAGGAAVLSFGNGDALTLDGYTKAALSALSANFISHA